MHVTLVKKRLVNGDACPKCVQAEELLKRRGLWERIDEVVWAQEGQADSAGMLIARQHGITMAPFFVVRRGTDERAYTSVLEFIKKELESSQPPSARAPDAPIDPGEVDALLSRMGGDQPQHILRWGQEQFGRDLVIAFSGAEDVALIDMAVKNGLPFSVLSLDTGRLHPETYRFIDQVRLHYAIEIRVMSPAAAPLQEFVRTRGLFSFYDDGHSECCALRKVDPLKRALADYRAWATGQRRDQSPTRNQVASIELDRNHTGINGPPMKLNPLAHWPLRQVWAYLRDNDVPTNPLHERGFVSVGCEPCTRAVRPGEHERAGRWWWEEETKRECGLHVEPDGSILPRR